MNEKKKLPERANAPEHGLTAKDLEQAVRICGSKKLGGSGCFGCPLQGVTRCVNRLFEALAAENEALRKFEQKITKVPDGERVAALQNQLQLCIAQKCSECTRNSPGEWDDGCRTLQVELVAALGKMHGRIKELEEQLRWIPVAERMAQVGDGPVLITDDCTAVLVLVMIEGAKTATTLYCDVDNHDFFDIQGDELIPYRVTHWRPMSKGPEVDA